MKNFIEIGKKIIAVGSNYKDHAKEMGNNIPLEPILFMKPTTSFLREGLPIEIPSNNEVHHEVELGIVIGSLAKNISENKAMDYVAGYCLALDLTARDLQQKAKLNGTPWFVAKGQDGFCPISRFIDKKEISKPENIQLWLKVNGELRQSGSIKDLIFNIPYLLAYTSRLVTLEPGDVFLTGTPAGVGPLRCRDVVTAGTEMYPANLGTGGFEYDKHSIVRGFL